MIQQNILIGTIALGFLSLTACDTGPSSVKMVKEIGEVKSVETERQFFASMKQTLKAGGYELSLPLGPSSLDFARVPSTYSKEWQAISGGRHYYLRGDDLGERSPIRFVALDYDFFIASKEVTRDQWRTLMKTDPSEVRSGEAENGDQPVNTVSWQDARGFLDAVTFAGKRKLERWRKDHPEFKDYVFRLPTESEWEYAARAGMYRPGEGYLAQTAWHNNASKMARPVGAKVPNPLGLYDTLGNVFELTADCWPSKANIKLANRKAIVLNPRGVDGIPASRGGGWFSKEHVESFGWRGGCNAKFHKGDYIGLRLVFAPPLSDLNEETPPPKPESVVVNTERRKLQKISEKYCDGRYQFDIKGSLDIEGLYVTREFNDHIEMEVCYDNSIQRRIHISALTYHKGKNTGKWSYVPPVMKQGKACSVMEVSKSSVFAYHSDAIQLELHINSCEMMFAYEKYWTDGIDERPAYLPEE
ncbi:MAG: SUMF1/EgtB/PvdO family nonheme iron enzyme [Nitrospinaceae bacterium]|nr:formylglycine-generating enzyme family protein [Nitrospinaceae bacterium]NIR55204.1 formylglycine-generating enzyme family protein [Nitrospinaceae bacterium]NIS85631.1 formylglycine-generating enzyme family protein [Nitrospinaceae bacterium]NIT82476.1 formylglycine-generating enzyme family protein [Nitrospinaceae bacterium]NIU44681.1 formylglycine-generating enzyme family protein [Nitrospinaceae bacterium]